MQKQEIKFEIDKVLKQPDPLPDTLSGLLEIAIEDIEAINKIKETGGYYLIMSSWYEPKSTYCYICMAGAVMVQRLLSRKRIEVELTPCSFIYSTITQKLWAINSLRMFHFNNAYCYLKDLYDKEQMEIKTLEKTDKLYRFIGNYLEEMGFERREVVNNPADYITVYKEVLKKLKEVGL